MILEDKNLISYVLPKIIHTNCFCFYPYVDNWPFIQWLASKFFFNTFFPSFLLACLLTLSPFLIWVVSSQLKKTIL
ncbi:MAG: hypothetical protein CM15mP22_7670 [Gammaproteobacteria bacterium]|nr:MAG: hypothetical protein CM15mP22_7670 [Gammaproteobacteria bacterium]